MMTPPEFDRLVEESLATIPARFRARLKNLAFIVEPEPPHPNLLGLYTGRPLPFRSVMESFAMPDRITIYQGPHERLAQSPEHLRHMVEDTVWHEVAHYFGMNEAQVRAWEAKRRAGLQKAARRPRP
ncbi:MAG: metallopeptidase family protein [Bryobacteraceae bacterium]